MIVKFQGIADRDAAGELRNQLVYVKTEDLPQLPDGEFYLHRIIGFQVIDEAGAVLGTLREILETGANDVYLVKAGQSEEELLLPAIESVILDVNFEKREMIVRLPEWY
jgi:16S rRNA processing protein RimM